MKIKNFTTEEKAERKLAKAAAKVAIKALEETHGRMYPAEFEREAEANGYRVTVSRKGGSWAEIMVTCTPLAGGNTWLGEFGDVYSNGSFIIK